MGKVNMEPTIVPLNNQGTIYALRDERGHIIGTGTREVCEILLYIITKPPTSAVSGRTQAPVPRTPNVRAATAI